MVLAAIPVAHSACPRNESANADLWRRRITKSVVLLVAGPIQLYPPALPKPKDLRHHCKKGTMVEGLTKQESGLRFLPREKLSRVCRNIDNRRMRFHLLYCFRPTVTTQQSNIGDNKVRIDSLP